MSLSSHALLCLVRERLLHDLRLAGQSIDVSCCEGCVWLVGAVDSPELKKLAVDLVSGLIGVRQVKDQLVVRTPRHQSKNNQDTWANA
ncbi:MAG: BON domain-containing protein [Armatimonadota bacterium]|nr:BON domain-containing protein [Armatimonadota bacterium]